MIFNWLWMALKFLLRLFVPPPKKAVPLKPIIADDASCPNCYSVGTMTVEHVTISTKPGRVDAIKMNANLFTCSKCKAYFYRKPRYTESVVDGRALGSDEIHGREVQGLAK